jgi:hypothetical protein
MSAAFKNWLIALYRGQWLSPAGFVKLTVGLVFFYVVLTAAGGREYVGFLSGTLPEGNQERWRILLGLLYALAYFAFVVAVPILVFAAVIYAILTPLGVTPKE